MHIAIDFDGTIVSSAFPEIGELLPNCKKVVSRIVNAGHHIIIWTCRNDDEFGDYKNKMIKWLDDNDFPYDVINENIVTDFHPHPKIYYDILIDDRSLLMSDPVNWSVVESELEKQGII